MRTWTPATPALWVLAGLCAPPALAENPSDAVEQSDAPLPAQAGDLDTDSVAAPEHTEDPESAEQTERVNDTPNDDPPPPAEGGLEDFSNELGGGLGGIETIMAPTGTMAQLEAALEETEGSVEIGHTYVGQMGGGSLTFGKLTPAWGLSYHTFMRHDLGRLALQLDLPGGSLSVSWSELMGAKSSPSLLSSDYEAAHLTAIKAGAVFYQEPQAMQSVYLGLTAGLGAGLLFANGDEYVSESRLLFLDPELDLLAGVELGRGGRSRFNGEVRAVFPLQRLESASGEARWMPVLTLGVGFSTSKRRGR